MLLAWNINLILVRRPLDLFYFKIIKNGIIKLAQKTLTSVFQVLIMQPLIHELLSHVGTNFPFLAHIVVDRLFMI